MWKQITLLYYTLLGGVVGFLGVAAFLVSSNGAFSNYDETTTNILATVNILMAVGSYFAAKLYDKLMLKKLENISEPVAKLNWFKSSLFIQIALLCGGSDFAIVFYLLTGKMIMLTPLIITLGVAVLIRPDVFKASELLKMEREEILKL